MEVSAAAIPAAEVHLEAGNEFDNRLLLFYNLLNLNNQLVKKSTMNANEPVEIELDEDGTKIAELLERAEKSFRITDDNKYYATREEILLLASQPDLDREPRIEKDMGGSWLIEFYHSRMIFIHATSCQDFVGQIVH